MPKGVRSIVSLRDQLVALSKPTPLPRAQISDKLKRRRWGGRAGAIRRASEKYKSFLPSIVMGNVRSLVI